MAFIHDTNIQKPFSPIIVNGAELADRYAARAAEQWIDAASIDFADGISRLKRFLDSPAGKVPANPKAQRKLIERATAALGDACVASFVATGKRGKWSFSIDLLNPDNGVNEIERYRQMICAGVDLPNTWLMGTRLSFKFSGVSGRVKLESDEHLIGQISRHALIRLVQRASVDSKPALLSAVRRLWPRIVKSEVATREQREKRTGDHWFVPFALEAGGEIFVAVMVGPEKQHFIDCHVVKTIKPLSMVRPFYRDAVLALHVLIDQPGLQAFSDMNALVAAFEAVREK